MEIFRKYILSHVCGDYITRVLDWQLDLLDHTQLHTIAVYTLYNSQQLSLFSSSEDFGSNSATTAATNSYGVSCHHSLTGNLTELCTILVTLSNRTAALTLYYTRNSRNCNSLLSCQLTNSADCHQLYSRGTDPKENTSSIPLLLDDVITGTEPKENASTVACLSVAIATVVNTCYIAYSIHVTV
jgi:hypothetical protein